MEEPVETAASRPWWRHLWLVGLAVYLAVVWWVGWDRLRAAMAEADWRWLVVTACLLALAQWLRAWKWRAALGPGKQAIRVHFLSKAGGDWSPARIGEFAPMLIPEHREARIGAWIAVDRILEVIVTLALGMAGLLALQVPERGVLLFAAAGLTVTGVLILYALAQGHWFEAIAVSMPGGSRRGRIALALAAAGREARNSYRTLPVTGTATFVACALDLCIGITTYGAFGYWAPLELFAVCKILFAVVATIPITPAATGAPALSVGYLLHEYAAVPPESLAAAVGANLVLTHIVFWSSFGLAMSLRNKA